MLTRKHLKKVDTSMQSLLSVAVLMGNVAGNSILHTVLLYHYQFEDITRYYIHIITLVNGKYTQCIVKTRQ